MSCRTSSNPTHKIVLTNSSFKAFQFRNIFGLLDTYGCYCFYYLCRSRSRCFMNQEPEAELFHLDCDLDFLALRFTLIKISGSVKGLQLNVLRCKYEIPIQIDQTSTVPLCPLMKPSSFITAEAFRGDSSLTPDLSNECFAHARVYVVISPFCVCAIVREYACLLDPPSEVPGQQHLHFNSLPSSFLKLSFSQP